MKDNLNPSLRMPRIEPVWAGVRQSSGAAMTARYKGLDKPPPPPVSGLLRPRTGALRWRYQHAPVARRCRINPAFRLALIGVGFVAVISGCTPASPEPAQQPPPPPAPVKVAT